jgi:Ca-activated chloride channel family protein
MHSTDSDSHDGQRLDSTITPVSRRVLDADGELVRRYLVRDEDDEEQVLLATPGSETLLDLKSGEQYRVRNLLWSLPPVANGDGDAECPSCGGALRQARAVDAASQATARAAARLGLEEPFGVIDDQTVITRVRGEDAVDDWRPMDEARPRREDGYVCADCHRQVSPRELEVARRGNDGAVLEDHHESVEQMNHSVTADASMQRQETVGLATGGAKDVENFRENVAAGYTPQPEAISDEGLFYDYHFETGEPTATDALFAPRYAAACSEHPLTGEPEQFLSVGLDSTLSVADFERPRLDLVAVLDVSGSMDSPFDQYYYDEHGRKQSIADEGSNREGRQQTKIEAATASLCALTEQLDDEDRLGVVLYNNRAHVAKPLRDVGSTDMVAIRQHIREIAAGGGTNLADGFEAAWDMLADGETTVDRERRVVFLTDMMPNTGVTEEAGLTKLFADAAAEGIHTTFVGMGLDANADLADTLSGIRGANHYFVHSAAEFEQRLGEEFAYMVTPLVYDLGLELEGAEIEAVHGSPSADAATDRLMHVTTLFPSAKEDGEARGGVVLVRLAGDVSAGDLELVATWTERDGSEHTERKTVDLPDDPEQFAHAGIRKAVVLSRYARELRSWARDVHERAAGGTGVDDWLLPDQRGEHERESVPLAVAETHAERFEQLSEYLQAELAVLADDTLEQELTLLDRLVSAGLDDEPVAGEDEEGH